MRNEVLRMLPQTVQIALTGIPDAQIEELRLRVGQKPAVRGVSVRSVSEPSCSRRSCSRLC